MPGLRIEFRHLSIEEGEEQRGDVGTVDIGVRHDDDPVVAQLLAVDSCRRVLQPSAKIRSVRVSWLARILSADGAGDVEDLAAQGQDGLGLPGCAPVWPNRRPNRLPPGRPRCPRRDLARAVGQLAGQAQLAWPPSCAFAPCRDRRLRRARSSEPSIDQVFDQHAGRARRIAGQEMVEVVARSPVRRDLAPPPACPGASLV